MGEKERPFAGLISFLEKTGSVSFLIANKRPQKEERIQIKIVSFDLVEGPGVLRAVADIEIGELLIRGFRVIQKGDSQPLRISPPAIKRHNADGSIEYRPIVVIMFQELKRKIEKAILEVYLEKKRVDE